VRTKQRAATFLAVALSLSAAIPAATLQAQSASDVLQKALDRYAEQMKGVDNYALTIGTSIMAQTYTVYYEKKMVNGHPTFVTPGQGQDQAASQWGNPYELLPQIQSRAALQGHEAVDGHDTFVIVVSDLSGIDFGQEALGSAQDAKVTPKKMALYMDSKDYLVRRMHMDGTITREGKSTPVTMDAHMTDYRDVKGLMQPYRTQISMEGLTGGISDEDRAQARQSLEALKQRLESMPQAQRSAMEQMLKPQMDKMQQMLDTGTMDVTIEVKDVQVNEGPPKSGGANSKGG
jgi:hypothetical protein